MKKCDEASLSIILAYKNLLVKLLISLEPHGIFGKFFVDLCILTLTSHWYKKCDEASPSIILAVKLFW